MSYNYAEERSAIFTEDGQRQFLEIRDRCKWLLKIAGAASMSMIISGKTGDSWQMMACVDRLVELGEITEIKNTYSGAGQHRLFVEAGA